MKHPFNPTCDCRRCAREHGRRNSQAKADHARNVWPAVRYRGRRTSATRTTRPAFGSAEWAETRGDDLGESPDY